MSIVMYGVSADLDLSFFVGMRLEQVCTGANEVILRFGDDVSILIQSEVTHSSSNGEVEVLYKAIAPAAPMFVSLIHRRVTKALAKPPACVLVEFGEGEVVEIHDSSHVYESFVITNKTIFIVV